MDITLQFLGAARNVTGSRYLLRANGHKILVDCGLYQERSLQERNWTPFPVPPSEIDAVLLTHAHLDHCGFLPRLVKDGFSGKIYCTSPTADIANIIMLDSGHLQEEDAAFKKKRHARAKHTPPRPVEPLYTVEDAEKVAPLFSHVSYDEVIDVCKGVQVSFYEAGHVFGSAWLKVRVDVDGTHRTLAFSGDMGRPDKVILNDPVPCDEADYVVIESTYGDRLHEKTADIPDLLADVIHTTLKAGGNLLIPSFALERAQEVLYHLNALLVEGKIPEMMVFMDSPMAIQITEVFERHSRFFDEELLARIRRRESPFDFPGLTMTRTTNQSKGINQISGSVMVIAGSGMCTGGRIKHHLVNNIERKESTVLFVGYQAEGTLGRLILDGKNPVRILGQERTVRARIERIHGFSAHADRNELYRWLAGDGSHQRRQVFVTHGETESAQAFARYITEQSGWKATVPEYRQKFTLS